ERKRAPESESVRHRPADHREEPDPSAKHPRQAAGALQIEMQPFVKIPGEHRKHCIVRKPFKQFADIGNPEWPFKSGSDLVETFGKAQSGSCLCGAGASAREVWTLPPAIIRAADRLRNPASRPQRQSLYFGSA